MIKQITNSGWLPIEKATKKPKKGMMRVYSYAPIYNEKRKEMTHFRHTNLEHPFGCRTCDFVIDIPEPPK